MTEEYLEQKRAQILKYSASLQTSYISQKPCDPNDLKKFSNLEKLTYELNEDKEWALVTFGGFQSAGGYVGQWYGIFLLKDVGETEKEMNKALSHDSVYWMSNISRMGVEGYKLSFLKGDHMVMGPLRFRALDSRGWNSEKINLNLTTTRKEILCDAIVGATNVLPRDCCSLILSYVLDCQEK